MHCENGIEQGCALERPRACGKFLFVGNEKLLVRGVTYGTFAPGPDGRQFPPPGIVELDFDMMAQNGINALRVYTPPPRWLLDLAWARGIRVLIGIPWAQHVAFLDDDAVLNTIRQSVRETVEAGLGHPAVLAYAIGNEIPAPIVRWYGRERIERFLGDLYRMAAAIDPDALFTYVNYPTTEYLDLPFLDFVSFNVYLEDREKLADYVARLQNISGDRPLLMGEVGLDSCRNGEQSQAGVLRWQLETLFAEGCAGSFVFAWTDEWYRGGFSVDDWDFGLTTRERLPKAALEAVSSSYAAVPPLPADVPLISVVVCTYNGARTLRECLTGVTGLDYPSYEVIVVDDGSTDDSASIAREFPVRLISTTNRGLSNARNTGWRAARGTIVAYIDDDATPDRHWLTHMAQAFSSGDFAGVGGPNIQPPEDHPIAHCVASAPGGPIHVLVGDREAEHIPGCNMAFRRSVLEEVGGFDGQFRIAGDDVDLCWRIQALGYKLGFHAGAMVWHHRRNKVSIYWRQQLNYGRAEAMLERKWPEKYNNAGHASWQGRLYGAGHRQFLSWRRGRIYQGVWGSAGFQSEETPAQNVALALPLMPEWYLVIAVLTGVAALGIVWHPLALAAPVAASAAIVLLMDAISGVRRANATVRASRRLRAITTMLFLIQPLARLAGRWSYGLTPWRLRQGRIAIPRPRFLTVWSERPLEHAAWLGRVQTELRDDGEGPRCGGAYDHWDLSLAGGMAGAARLLMIVEEHGSGRQYVRIRVWPVLSRAVPPIALILAVAAAASFHAGSPVWIPLIAGFGLILLLAALQCGSATAALARAAQAIDPGNNPPTGHRAPEGRRRREAGPALQPATVAGREVWRSGPPDRPPVGARRRAL